METSYFVTKRKGGYLSSNRLKGKRIKQTRATHRTLDDLDVLFITSTHVKEAFTKSELIALKLLIRFSAKVPGICNTKIQTIVAATHNDTIGISRSTFERMLRKAKALGFIKIHNTSTRGYQAHNVYVFTSYPTKKLVQSKNIDVPIKANNPSKSINLLNNKRIDLLDSTYVSSRVPKCFTVLVRCFFDNATILEEYYHMYCISTYWLTSYNSNDLLDIR